MAERLVAERRGERRGDRCPLEVLRVLTSIPDQRQDYSRQLAAIAWGLAGNPGSPPPWVADASAVQLSAHGSFALAAHDIEEAAGVSTKILLAVLDAAAEDGPRKRRGDDPARVGAHE